MIDKKWIKFAEESLDERYRIRNMMEDSERQWMIENNYYKGMLKMIENLGGDWERDEDGHHHIYGFVKE